MSCYRQSPIPNNSVDKALYTFFGHSEAERMWPLRVYSTLASRYCHKVIFLSALFRYV